MNKHLLKLIIFFALTAATIEPTNAKGKEKRLEKIFTKGKYERCLKKCNRMLHRKLTSLPYYYISFVHFQHFKSPPTDKTHLTENYLQSAILNLSFALEIDYNEKNKQNYTLRLTEIKDTLIAKNHSLIAEEKWDASLIYAQKVWEFFSDSTVLIASREAIKNIVPLEIEPVAISQVKFCSREKLSQKTFSYCLRKVSPLPNRSIKILGYYFTLFNAGIRVRDSVAITRAACLLCIPG